MKALFTILPAFVLLLLPALTSADSFVKNVDTVSQDPVAYQDKWITVRGFTGMDEQGHEYLFGTLRDAKEKDLSTSIDLAALPGQEKAMSLLKDKACADVYGKFNAYGSRYLPMGYLSSHAGLINVKRISECPN